MNRKYLYILYVLLWSSYCLLAQDNSRKIRTAFDSKDYQLTIDEINMIQASQINFDSILYLKAYSQIKLNQLKEATVTIKQMLQINPLYNEAYLLKGMIYAKKEKYADAIECFNRVIEVSPKNEKAYYNRALAKGLLEDYKNAIKDLDKSISINPNYALAYYNRGYWYELTENYNAAIIDYKKSIEIDKQYNEAYFALAYVYSKIGDEVSACETLQTAKQQGILAADDLMQNFCK